METYMECEICGSDQHTCDAHGEPLVLLDHGSPRNPREWAEIKAAIAVDLKCTTRQWADSILQAADQWAGEGDEGIDADHHEAWFDAEQQIEQQISATDSKGYCVVNDSDAGSWCVYKPVETPKLGLDPNRQFLVLLNRNEMDMLLVFLRTRHDILVSEAGDRMDYNETADLLHKLSHANVLKPSDPYLDWLDRQDTRTAPEPVLVAQMIHGWLHGSEAWSPYSHDWWVAKAFLKVMEDREADAAEPDA